MKGLFLAVTLALFAGCFTPEEAGIEEEKYSSTTQAIVVCASDCAPPTYDGNPVACASNIYCYSDAAGAYCLNGNSTWSTAACRTAAGPPCGDGICNGSETWQTCSDCPRPIECGDNLCNGNETPQSCAADCAPPPCGNGICDGHESPWNCSLDCGNPCPGCHEP